MARRLLLASLGLGALPTFLGDDRDGLRVAWVPTAANAIDPGYALHNRDLLQGLGLDVVPLELETAAPNEVRATLERVDAIFVEGGNVFVLLHHALRSGFAELLAEALDRGCSYVGVSAGAVLLGPDVWPASQVGREVIPELQSTQGLGLIELLVMPHHNDPARKAVHAQRLAEFGRRYRLIFIDDDQAIEAHGSDWRLVPSP